MLILYYILFCIIFKYAIFMEVSTQKNEYKNEMKPFEISDSSITSNVILNEVERFYLDYIFHSDVKDSICSMPRIKKITLCKQIFQQSHFISLYFQLNRVAFFTNSMDCEEHLVEFKETAMFLYDKIPQKMYPCYGRHDPMRTNYRVDDYYEKFYVSMGKTQDSIIVYIRKNDGQSDRFYSYSYQKNINFGELLETKINIKETQTELQEPLNISVTTNAIEIEKIYLQEIIEFRRTDTICNLDKSLKVSLCKKIFEYYIFKKLGVTINITAHYIFQPKCDKRFLTLRFLKHPRNKKIVQLMYNCYARRLLKTDNVLKDQFINTFSLSEGPRENSVLVYYYNNVRKEMNLYNHYLFLLLENIHINFLEPMLILIENAANESLYSVGIINKIQDNMREFNYIDTIRVSSFKNYVRDDITYKLQKYYSQMSLNKKQYNVLIKKEEKLILNTLFSAIDDEEDRINSKFTKKVMHEDMFAEELVEYRIKVSRNNIKLFYKNKMKAAKLNDGLIYRKTDIPLLIEGIKSSITWNHSEITDKVFNNEIAVILSDIIEDVNSV